MTMSHRDYFFCIYGMSLIRTFKDLAVLKLKI